MPMVVCECLPYMKGAGFENGSGLYVNASGLKIAEITVKAKDQTTTGLLFVNNTQPGIPQYMISNFSVILSQRYQV